MLIGVKFTTKVAAEEQGNFPMEATLLDMVFCYDIKHPVKMESYQPPPPHKEANKPQAE